VVRGVRVATDWNVAPPELVWRRRIGPAWSSVVVVGDRLFTQEQRGPQEAVVCLDAATGRTVWSHEDDVRHEDVQGGAGPRATPAFAGGRIFALGATGILNCLDAETGARKWRRDLAADAETKIPMWGFSSSPLVVGDLVVVFAGCEAEKTLLAYRTDSGRLAWSAPAGKVSYSSPHLASVGGAAQLLFVSDRGLAAFDPSSGAVLWEHPTPPGNPGVPRAVQPRAVGPRGVLFDAGPDLGTRLVEVAQAGRSWAATERWLSPQLKPSFNDFVVYGQALYGFDGRILTCVDLETGRRRWKGGRYGSGQVLLLGDQGLLVVVTDEGEAVLVAADPDGRRELGRFRAVEGKTWNHPAIANGRLYVRNAREVACYQLRPEGPR
jgi:outer membrane protein assembly factor BamB